MSAFIGEARHATTESRSTFFLCVFHDIKSSSIFDASTRILELCFAVDVATELVGQTVDANQRCAADGTDEALDGGF